MRLLLSRSGYALYLLPLLFLGIFFLYPLLTIFDISLRPGGALDLSAFGRLVSSNYYIETLLFTSYQAALSTGLTLMQATPCAYVFPRYRFDGISL
ncbi:MAG: iron ABC transporter permease, partial [Chloroflexi bacterium]|nr:iron ABC transporter permease [Chloroflexota bacterium]